MSEDTRTEKVERRKDNWLRKHWRPMCAAVYMGICIFDFVIVPSWIGLTREKYVDLVPLVKALPVESQVVVLDRKQWEPLTLMGGGMFHLAFGALLTGAAVTRGLTQKEHAKNGVHT